MLWIIGFWATFSKRSILKTKRFGYRCWLSRFLNIFILNFSRMLTLLSIFSERTFSNVLLSSTQKNKKWAIFVVLMTITVAVNTITRQSNPIFLILSIDFFLLVYTLFCNKNFYKKISLKNSKTLGNC